MSLFNATIQQLTNSINEVLTECYLHIYGGRTFGSRRERDALEDGDKGLAVQWGSPFDKTTRVELVLMTSPLSATEELINIYSAGLADFELLAPIALSSIGASNSDIDAMMKRVKQNKSTMSVAAQPKEESNANSVEPDNSKSRGKGGSSTEDREKTNSREKEGAKTNEPHDTKSKAKEGAKSNETGGDSSTKNEDDESKKQGGAGDDSDEDDKSQKKGGNSDDSDDDSDDERKKKKKKKSRA